MQIKSIVITSSKSDRGQRTGQEDLEFTEADLELLHAATFLAQIAEDRAFIEGA